MTPLIVLTSFSIAIGFDQVKAPAALIMDGQTLGDGYAIAMSAQHAEICGSDISLVGAEGTVVLKSVAGAIKESAEKSIPILVLDAASKSEHLIKFKAADCSNAAEA